MNLINLQPFFSFFVAFDESMAHNMLALMLESSYWGMQCIYEYIGLERTKVVVENYDNKVLVPMLVKVYHFLNVKHIFASTLDPIVLMIPCLKFMIHMKKTNEGLLRS